MRTIATRRRTLRSCWGLFLAAFVAAGSVARPSVAQPSPEELSQARAKFQQATELEQAGNWAAALLAFREVGQVKMTPQVRYHIALCEENLGKLVAALGGYELAAADADAVGPGFREEVESSIRRLEARIPHLTIERGPGAQAATIVLDGVSLGASSVGVPVPVDPGPHTLSASAPGYEDFSTTVDAAEGGEEAITIELTKLPTEERPPPPPPEVGKGQQQSLDLRTLSYVVGGAGAACLITSGVFFYLLESNTSDMEDICGGDGTCRNDSLTEDQLTLAKSLNGKIATYYYLTLVTGGLGVAGLGAGGYLYYRSTRQQAEKKPSEPAEPADSDFVWRLDPVAPGADIAGLSFVGRF
ncbi:MAG: PEGA domain-containing protein [Polyangiaceae bacterium]|nr:PEGA domain-containing protein [Polyangiaceae bacterium]